MGLNNPFSLRKRVFTKFIAVCDLVEYSSCLLDRWQKYQTRPEINFRIVETLHVTSLQVG
ncbi:hypothetical protein MiSe_75200 [Microseira wollei NIES-4236]|uniref:Transposase n=1 Tax=Microseira wollei NIES-4236 TaxID=2530354 RepID=A0AAV3XSA4_9CYAN|nr:hypothetical protein MiSe_75200 [Microseira wollei NIES-4236]